jgi:hypothetical protein
MSSNSQKTLQPVFFVACTMLLVACAHQPPAEAFDPPGFFSGLWNGLTILFALVGHLFDDGVRIYAFPNSGGWYDFGYFLGVSMFLGGGGSAASR